MEYFVISAKFVPRWNTIYTLIATTASSLFFSWVFGSANSVTRPDQYNAKMVYSSQGSHFKQMSQFTRTPSEKIWKFWSLLAQNNIKTQGPLTWNKLNIKIKNSPSLASFKTNLKKHILDQYEFSTIDTKYAPTSQSFSFLLVFFAPPPHPHLIYNLFIIYFLSISWYYTHCVPLIYVYCPQHHYAFYESTKLWYSIYIVYRSLFIICLVVFL